MTEQFHCTWCGAEKSSRVTPCPDQCDRPAGYRAAAAYTGLGTGPARVIVLTDLGWEQAGYVRDGAGWRKAP